MGVDRITNRIVQIISSVVAVVGIAIIGAGAAVLIQFAGSMQMLAQGLSMWLGIFITIYGILIVLTAMITLEATAGFADSQGYFSGKFRLFWAIFVIFLIACLSAYVTFRLYMYQLILSNNLSTLQEVSDSIRFSNDDFQISEQIKTQSVTVATSTIEESIGKVFNYLFAHAVSDCNANSGWFWAWVNSHCPNNIHHDRCLQCPAYTLSYCAADVTTCSSSSSSDACAFNICREGILEFLLQYPLQYAVYVVGGLAILYLCECFSMLILATCTRVTDKQVIRVVPLAEEDEDDGNLDKPHAMEENNDSDNDEEKQVDHDNEQQLQGSNQPYPSDIPHSSVNVGYNLHTNYSNMGFIVPNEPSQQLPPQVQPSYSQQILQQYHLAGFLSPTGDNTTGNGNNFLYPMSPNGQNVTDINNSSFPANHHAGTGASKKNTHELSSATEDEQLQLALALTLAADAKDSQRQNNHNQMTSSFPAGRALQQSEDDEDLQVALALSKTTTANSSNPNALGNSHIEQNRAEEEDDLQLALALSLSTSEQRRFK